MFVLQLLFSNWREITRFGCGPQSFIVSIDFWPTTGPPGLEHSVATLPTRDLTSKELQTSISLDPTTFTLKIIECTDPTVARNTTACSTQTVSLLPVIPVILGGRDYDLLTSFHWNYFCFLFINRWKPKWLFHSSVPLVLTFLSQLSDGRPRLPSQPTPPTPPTSPPTPAPRVPDPLEDFATFASVCSKVYGNQGKCDKERPWLTDISSWGGREASDLPG